jgi:putative hydrolase of the HAD superfamily
VKALMVDVDGVVVRASVGEWAANMEADLGFSRQAFQQHFFTPHWNDVVLGRARLHERLGPVLAEHAPHLTSHQLAAYWFERDAELDMSLLADLATLRATGVQLHLATIQEHERAAYLWTSLGLRDHFDAMHYAADIGWKKTDAEFYRVVEARTGLSGQDLLLLDDTATNIEAARAAGWRGALWDGTARLAGVVAAAQGR